MKIFYGTDFLPITHPVVLGFMITKGLSRLAGYRRRLRFELNIFGNQVYLVVHYNMPDDPAEVTAPVKESEQ